MQHDRGGIEVTRRSGVGQHRALTRIGPAVVVDIFQYPDCVGSRRRKALPTREHFSHLCAVRSAVTG